VAVHLALIEPNTCMCEGLFPSSLSLFNAKAFFFCFTPSLVKA
jgi:hypothetical protein